MLNALLGWFRRPKPISRDAYGHFASDHRAHVRARCREMCEALGRPVPGVLAR